MKDDKYDAKRRKNTLLIELKDGQIIGVYRMERPRHLTSEVMIVDLDAQKLGKDIRAVPIDVVPDWAAHELTRKAIDKLRNVYPEQSL